MILRLHKFQKISIIGAVTVLTFVLVAFIHKIQRESESNMLKLSTELPIKTPEGKSNRDLKHEENLKQDIGNNKAEPVIIEQSEGVEVYEKSPFNRPKLPPSNYVKEKATFFSLVRNSDLYGILHSIRQVEDRFNNKYHYDWVFANDKPFTQNFKKIVQNLCSGNVIFVELTKEFWSYPEWIDQNKAREVRQEMARKKIKYGSSASYRQMCRFNSGLFYKLPLLLEYKYYWRVEPDIEYHCDIDYDPFKYMRENNKVYGFNLAPLELHTTVTSLWDTVKNYTNEYPDHVANDNNMEFLSDDGGETFNMCHFWSNFEIGDLDFFRSDTYNHFFDYLDHAGGIYYERWGDLPIHSMAVSLLIPKDQLFFVPDTGYFHNPNGDCPRSLDLRLEKNCNCNPRYDFTWSLKSCIPKFFDIHNIERPKGAPKRKYKPIHNWEEVTKEEERHERARVQAELRMRQEEEEALRKQKLEKGVEASENIDENDAKLDEGKLLISNGQQDDAVIAEEHQVA